MTNTFQLVYQGNDVASVFDGDGLRVLPESSCLACEMFATGARATGARIEVYHWDFEDGDWAEGPIPSRQAAWARLSQLIGY